VPKNGVLDLARAVPAILRKHPDAVFVFAGSEDPACAEEVRRALRVAGVLHACRFLGPVPHDRMPHLLRAATVCVLPSHVEATSLAGLEAMACGVPLVGTRVGGIPEILTNGETGLLVPPSSPEDLAGAVTRLLADSDLAHRLAKAARDRVVAAFSWDRIAEQFLEVYRRAVSIGRDSIP
jgi:glycosyltransferase involved in cell wall biosynthesis